MTIESIPSGPRLRGALWATQTHAQASLAMPKALGLATMSVATLACVLGLLRPSHDVIAPEIIMQAILVPPEEAKVAKLPVPPPVVKHAVSPPHAGPAAMKKVEPPAHVAAAVTPEAAAPAIATATADAAPALPTAPPVQPATQAKVVAPAATRAPAIGVICPTQVKPQMPQRAIDDGISGIVHVRALIAGGRVKEVVIVDGPRVFHAAVKAAMMRYQCQQGLNEQVWAEQQFAFKLNSDE